MVIRESNEEVEHLNIKVNLDHNENIVSARA